MHRGANEQLAGEFDPGLTRGQMLNIAQLQRVFQCGSLGGMRRSLRTNSLVLISEGKGSEYYRRWDGTVFYCTGMGLTGDQSLGYAQNRTLADSDTNGVAVFHFDNHEPNRYIFTGRVRLAGQPFAESQPDKRGRERQVWVFPLTVAPPGSGPGEAGGEATPAGSEGRGRKWKKPLSALRKAARP